MSAFSLPKERLKVISKCEPTGTFTCNFKSVMTTIDPLNFDENHIKPSDWVILVLMRPFELQDAGVIPIAGKNHLWDPQDCLIYHWMFVRVLKDPRRIIFDEGKLTDYFDCPKFSAIYFRVCT